MNLPSFDRVMYESIHSPPLIARFNYECACNLNYDHLPDLLNNRYYLKDDERIQVELLIDYIINFVYVTILLTNDFQKPHFFIIYNE